MSKAPSFNQYVGIDYSGAQTPTSSLRGLRVYLAGSNCEPLEVPPPPSPRKYWTRRGIAEWLVDLLAKRVPTLVGIDHGFSFPLEYFEENGVSFDPKDWTAFLEEFQKHWPTDEDNMYVDFIRDGTAGHSHARSGRPEWRRLTEIRARTAKSVFRFDVRGSVAKSTHAGLPWLLYVRQRTKDLVHFWPFDGWAITPGRSVVTEAYPALWNRGYARVDRSQDQHDAYSIAAWLRDNDCNGSLSRFFSPDLTEVERQTAKIEGWILGLI